MISIRNAGLSDIPMIQQLAEDTWWPTYRSIISEDQIRYMLDTIYSRDTLQNAIVNGSQAFIIIEDERGPQGFASYGEVEMPHSKWKLHKLYVKPDNHGKGYGRLLIDEVKSRLTNKNIDTLYLNVNRHNPAKKFYERLGFSIVKEEDIPVGPYWMNDYVMCISLT